MLQFQIEYGDRNLSLKLLDKVKVILVCKQWIVRVCISLINGPEFVGILSVVCQGDS